MEKQREIYAVSVDGDVGYVKVNGSMYLHSMMSEYELLEPYINNKRGVYLLIGNGKAYIGEGDVFTRLTKHRTAKPWVEDVYVYLTDTMMTKEDSLQYEGAIEKYIKTYTNYKVENKVRVRDNDIDVTKQIQAFKWLGLTVREPEVYLIKNIQGGRAFTVEKTINNTLKVHKSHSERLQWLEGMEFRSLQEVTLIAETLAIGEGFS